MQLVRPEVKGFVAYWPHGVADADMLHAVDHVLAIHAMPMQAKIQRLLPLLP
jgi:hypothetical protein